MAKNIYFTKIHITLSWKLQDYSIAGHRVTLKSKFSESFGAKCSNDLSSLVGRFVRSGETTTRAFISDSIDEGINCKVSREEKRSRAVKRSDASRRCMRMRAREGEKRRLEGNAYPSCTFDTEDLADGVRKILFAIRAFS